MGLCGWIGFMASFNGRFYDGGYSGHEVQIKSLSKRDYITEQIKNTLVQIESLKGVKYCWGDYSTVNIPNNSIVYCDIPYKNTKQYAYSKDFDYDKFYEFCKKLSKNGHEVFISEYWMPNDFECVWSKEVTTAINQTITKKPTEKLYKVK